MKRSSKLSPSEKGRRAARAQQIARREQREAEEVQAQLKAIQRRRPGALVDVPPWCHLSGTQSPEEAAAEAMSVHKTTTATDALVLLWNLRRMSVADADFLASAETCSAENQPETIANSRDGLDELGETLVSTHKHKHLSQPPAACALGTFNEVLP